MVDKAATKTQEPDEFDSLFESNDGGAPKTADEYDTLFDGEPQEDTDAAYEREKKKERAAAIGALGGAAIEGTEYLGHKAWDWAVPKIQQVLNRGATQQTMPVETAPSAISGEGVTRSAAVPNANNPYSLIGADGKPLSRATGPGQQIDNYTLSLMKHTPESQTITQQEAKGILSAEEAQEKLAENVKKTRQAQSVEPSARVVSAQTGLMSTTVPWVNPLTGETERAPALKEVDPVTGKTRTIPDPSWIKAREKVVAAAIKEANKSKVWEGVKDFGRGAKNLVYDMGRGALHGANAILQGQEAIDKRNVSIPETAAHATSALGSVADLVRPLLSQASDAAVGRVAGPLAVGGMGVADLLEEFRKGEYYKMPQTAIAAPMLLSLSTMPAGAVVMYLRDHPEVGEELIKERRRLNLGPNLFNILSTPLDLGMAAGHIRNKP